MSRFFSKSIFGLSSAFLFIGCGSAALVSTPVENIDTSPLKISDLTDVEKKNWGHLDLASDTIPGMSVDKAYRTIIGNKKGKKVIVAVLDSGMDLKHEDLNDVLWINKGERVGDGKDNDNNGYIDDIHGYNFVGEAYNEQLEAARIVKLKLGDANLQAKAKAVVEEGLAKAIQNKQQYEQILQAVKNADEAVKKELGKNDYTQKDVASIKPKDEAMQQHVGVLKQMYTFNDSIPEVIEELNDGIIHFSDQANHHYNVNFDGRKIVGDNPYDINDTNYGNGDPQNKDAAESHATHVAGIIGAERNNGKGANGVANNVAIMSVRTTPRGDEYDKDVALGIRYAVDNGAKVINASFGKAFSPKAEWVYDAIKYAASKDVLIVTGAGNDGNDIDNLNNPKYPNDHANSGTEISDNLLNVGALEPKYGSELVANYSNYGKNNVDVFAPGSAIYSTLPNNKYGFEQGTSMASPAVAGVAALIRSQYPKLSASQVKKIIMKSGLPIKAKVVLGGEAGKVASLNEISTSGKIVNAYNALLMAEEVSTGKVKL